MPRIQGIDPASAEGEVKATFAAQTRQWGAPLGPHLLYARRPAIFRGAQAMWRAIYACQKVDPALRALLNRRVASLNGCEF
jgi:alkylhydroperoxidase family enzyme